MISDLRARFHLKKIFKKTIPGFTLIELSIVMIIIGLITGAIFKAQDLMESARMRSTWEDISRVRVAVLSYREAFNAWPGNDNQALVRLGGAAVNGGGDGIIAEAELDQVWVHLDRAGYVTSPAAPVAKIGGKIWVQGNPAADLTGNWIVLGQRDGGEMKPVLTPKQALSLKQKSGESDIMKGSVRIRDGHGVAAGSCVRNHQLNLETNAAVCTAFISF